MSFSNYTKSVSTLIGNAGRGALSIPLMLVACGVALQQLLNFDSYAPERREINRSLRLGLVACVLTICGTSIAYRLFDVQTTEHQKWLKLAARQQDSSIRIQGARGSIFDRNGRVLAASVESVSLGVHPKQIKDGAAFSEKLAKVVTLPAADVQTSLSSNRSFAWLARGLPRGKREAIRAADLRGLSLHVEPKRYYPQGDLAAPVLGRVNTDGRGLSGIELAFEDLLGASISKVPVMRDAKGRLFASPAKPQRSTDAFLRYVSLGAGELNDLAELDRSNLRSRGQDVVLTIDSVVQQILEEEVEQGFANAQARYVSAVTMDAETGELLGLAQYPRFNPNTIKVKSKRLRDRIIQDSFEPGSTMKPLVAAIALDAGLVNETEIMDCENGAYRIGRHTIRDVHPVAKVPLSEVLVRSSNICMAKLGQRLGSKKLHHALANLGFGKQSGIELSGEAKGILRDHKRWAKVDVATHSFGQGLATTALQMVRAYAAVANGGMLVTPTIIMGSKQTPAERVLSKQAANAVFAMLTGVTESKHGTGKNAAISGLHVSGKTGTAQKPHLSRRGYDPDRVVSSFIGMVDGSPVGVDRRLVTLIVVDEPSVRPRWGGTVAAPVFRRAMERIISHLMTSEGASRFQTAMGGERYIG